MIKFLIFVCAFVTVAYSPLTLADHITPIAKSNEDIQKYMAFEGNATLQQLVRAKYGVNIDELLDFFSPKDDNDTDVSGPYCDSTAPEWQPKLIEHLVNEEIQKSNETLKLTPETFVDNGRGYLEFSIKIKNMTVNDEVFCRDVKAGQGLYISYYKRNEYERNENITFWARWPLYSSMNGTSVYCKAVFQVNGTKHHVQSETVPIVFQTAAVELINDWGPWVWPSSRVVIYHKPILVKLDCWVWLYKNATVSWYLIQGNNKKEIATAMQNVTRSYVKLEFSKMIDVSDNGSEIICDNKPKSSVYWHQQRITFFYYGPTPPQPIDAMLGWGMLALLALPVILALAIYIVLVTIDPDKKKSS